MALAHQRLPLTGIAILAIGPVEHGRHAARVDLSQAVASE
ncbi:hypothetical protein RR42_s2161 [Cupriavidus basilensis]|uniref:Uncharacterized protein n=1 Tax=Cupriavidus basilensis TaxID=68895 RepID=A0A0C4YKZ1_9BURK|nr:hypothetical protein RR42_s2161 [Cupriavidus basilensis]